MERLSGLPHLEDLLLIGNPLYNEWKDNGALPQYRIEVRVWVQGGCRARHEWVGAGVEGARSNSGALNHTGSKWQAIFCAATTIAPTPRARMQVLKRVPTLKKLDGQPVDVEEREAAGVK